MFSFNYIYLVVIHKSFTKLFTNITRPYITCLFPFKVNTIIFQPITDHSTLDVSDMTIKKYKCAFEYKNPFYFHQRHRPYGLDT